MAEEREIDLIDVFSYIAHHTARRKLIILLIFVICLALPLIYYFIKPVRYSSKMSLATNEASMTMVEQICAPLIQSINNGQSAMKQQLLNLPAEITGSLEHAEIEGIKESPPSQMKGAIFTIEYVSTDPQIFSQLGEPTLKYLNENTYVKERTEVNRKQLESLQAEIAQQISRLDSIQKIIPHAIANYDRKDKFSWSDFNLGTVYQQMVTLRNSQMETAQKLEFVEEFRIISGFSIVQATKSWQFYVIAGLIGGLLLNIFYLIFAAIGDSIRKKTA